MRADARKKIRELAEKLGPLEITEEACPGGMAEPFPPKLEIIGPIKREDGRTTRLVIAGHIDPVYGQAFIEAVTAVPSLLDDVDRLEAENAALQARVEKLEEVRKAAEEVSYKYSDDYSEDNLRWNELIGALADADALDRANKENQ